MTRNSIATARPSCARRPDPAESAEAAALAELDRGLVNAGRVGRPALRPRPAAALIVADLAGAEPRVLLGRRNPALRFLPDSFVFPGGAVDPGDGRVGTAAGLRDDELRRLLAASPGLTPTGARALAVAAVRELGEETGLLLGEADTAPVPRWPGFAERRIAPRLDCLRFVARAITPPGMIRRYDTRFFLADAADIAGEIAGIVGPDAELVELCWATPEGADLLPLHAMTRAILAALRQGLHSRFERAMAVPFFRARRGRFVRSDID